MFVSTLWKIKFVRYFNNFDDLNKVVSVTQQILFIYWRPSLSIGLAVLFLLKNRFLAPVLPNLNWSG